jgi:hypothetical protein
MDGIRLTLPGEPAPLDLRQRHDFARILPVA